MADTSLIRWAAELLVFGADNGRGDGVHFISISSRTPPNRISSYK